MKPIETSTTNAVYTLEGCHDLPVTKYINANNNEQGVEVVWELSPEDMEKVKETGKVFLYIQGDVVPPVLLTSESQIYFKDGDENADAE